MANSINPTGMLVFFCKPDYEYQRIIKRLKEYGITPTGNKTTDRNRLREIELREAEQENSVSSKFITVTKAEQEKIQARKKQSKVEVNPEIYPTSTQGQKLLGEQIMLAIKMKQEKD